jgi:MFS family permease
MRTASFWWLFFGYVAGFYVFYSIQVHQTKYLIDSGFSVEQAAFALALVGLSGVIGQIAVGYLSDRVGREWGWTVSILGFTICYLVLIFMRYHPVHFLLYLMVFSQGLLGYGMSSVYGAIPAELFEGKRYGEIYGMFGIAAGIGAGIGPWVTGAIYDVTADYVGAFALAMFLSIFSIMCIWFAAPRKVRLVAGQAARRSPKT